MTSLCHYVNREIDKAQVTNANLLERKKILECNSMEDADHLCILQCCLDDFGCVLLGCGPERRDKA